MNVVYHLFVVAFSLKLFWGRGRESCHIQTWQNTVQSIIACAAAAIVKLRVQETFVQTSTPIDPLDPIDMFHLISPGTLLWFVPCLRVRKTCREHELVSMFDNGILISCLAYRRCDTSCDVWTYTQHIWMVEYNKLYLPLPPSRPLFRTDCAHTYRPY